jgi:hypothetical protein
MKYQSNYPQFLAVENALIDELLLERWHIELKLSFRSNMQFEMAKRLGTKFFRDFDPEWLANIDDKRKRHKLKRKCFWHGDEATGSWQLLCAVQLPVSGDVHADLVLRELAQELCEFLQRRWNLQKHAGRDTKCALITNEELWIRKICKAVRYRDDSYCLATSA